MSVLVLEKNTENRTAYFLILEKISDVESDLCDQMRFIVVFYLAFCDLTTIITSF